MSSESCSRSVGRQAVERTWYLDPNFYQQISNADINSLSAFAIGRRHGAWPGIPIEMHGSNQDALIISDILDWCLVILVECYVPRVLGFSVYFTTAPQFPASSCDLSSFTGGCSSHCLEQNYRAYRPFLSLLAYSSRSEGLGYEAGMLCMLNG